MWIRKKYKVCHGNKEDQQILDTNIPVDSGIERRLNNSKIKHCIHPKAEECSAKIIKAHTIQNNRILNRIGRDGKIYMVRFTAESNKPRYRFKEVGRSQATTITGFCSNHDKMLFQPIEDSDYVGTQQQNYLFAYRAFAYEYQRKIEASKSHTNLIDDKPSLLNDEHYQALQEGYKLAEVDNIREKIIFDNALLQGDYNVIETVSITLEGESKFAVCSGFNLEYDLNGDIVNRLYDHKAIVSLLTLNVFPQNGKTIVLLSWLKEDTAIYNAFSQQIQALNTEEIKQMLNNMIPSYCENAVYNPIFIDSWSDKAKQEYLRIFKNSTISGIVEINKRNLLLKTNFNLF